MLPSSADWFLDSREAVGQVLVPGWKNNSFHDHCFQDDSGVQSDCYRRVPQDYFPENEDVRILNMLVLLRALRISMLPHILGMLVK